MRSGKNTADHESKLLPIRYRNGDFFLADLFGYAFKGDGASMEVPIFSLSTKPDLSVWRWISKDGKRGITVTPSVLGRATQHDKDVLIYVISQMTEGLNRDRQDAKHRTVRFTVYDYLVATNRGVSGTEYKSLKLTLNRLRGTTIATNIYTGGQKIDEGFGLIDHWRVIKRDQGQARMVSVEITLSTWLYNAVQAFEIFTLHKDYFRLRKPIERRLYELARKHCGHSTTFAIGLQLLREKAGSKSKASLKEFRRMVREIIADDTLPQYRLMLDQQDKVTFYAKDASRLIRGLAARGEAGIAAR